MGWTISLISETTQDQAAGSTGSAWPQSVADFEALVTAVQDELVHFAFCRVHNVADAEDAVQDVLVRAYLDRAKHRAVTSVRPYLFRMVANRCTDVLRGRQRAERRYDLSDPAMLAAAEVLEPDHRGAGAPLEEIEGLLTRLPRRQAEVLRLRVFGRLPFKAIAEAVGASLPTIKSRFRYGVERLRGILTKELGR